MEAARRAGTPRTVESIVAFDSAARVELEQAGCLFCSSRDATTIVTGEEELDGRRWQFHVVQCSDCGLSYTNPRPTSASIGRFYGPDSQPAGHVPAEGPLRRWADFCVLRAEYGYPPQAAGWHVRLGAVLGRCLIRRSRQRRHWIPFMPPGRLLDFGCGLASFLPRMRRYGWHVTGLDFDPRVAAGLRERDGIDALVGSLPHPQLSPHSFDAVTMWNSLEHVHEPVTVLKAAHDILRPGGLLVVGVPNLACWSFERFKAHWYALWLPRHLTHFTPATLTRLVEQTGFEVIELSHIGRSGWLRRSAQAAYEAGDHSWVTRMACSRCLASRLAAWTERAKRADFIRLLARKPA